MSATLSKQDRLKRRQEIQKIRKESYIIRKFGDDLREEDDAHEIGMGDEINRKI